MGESVAVRIGQVEPRDAPLVAPPREPADGDVDDVVAELDIGRVAIGDVTGAQRPQGPVVRGIVQAHDVGAPAPAPPVGPDPQVVVNQGHRVEPVLGAGRQPVVLDPRGEPALVDRVPPQDAFHAREHEGPVPLFHSPDGALDVVPLVKKRHAGGLEPPHDAVPIGHPQLTVLSDGGKAVTEEARVDPLHIADGLHIVGP